VQTDHRAHHEPAREIRRIFESRPTEVFHALTKGDWPDSEKEAAIAKLEILDGRCAVTLSNRLTLLGESIPDGNGELQSGWVAAVKRRMNKVVKFIDVKAQKFQVGNEYKQFEAELAEFESAARIALLAAASRSVLLNLRCALNLSRTRNEMRIRELQASLQKLAVVEEQFFANRELMSMAWTPSSTCLATG
jgi:hypothetical protein